MKRRQNIHESDEEEIVVDSHPNPEHSSDPEDIKEEAKEDENDEKDEDEGEI